MFVRKLVNNKKIGLRFFTAEDALKAVPTTFKSFINGKYVDNSDKNDVYNTGYSVTGEVLAPSEIAREKEVNMAVESAIEAQKVWAEYSGMERSRILRKAADIIGERNDELAYYEAIDTGRPIAETKIADPASCREAIDYFAGLAPSLALNGRHTDMAGGSFAYTRREPLGVIGAIGAWNYPIQGAGWKAGPALACGNAMVFKPAEDTPWTALKLAEILVEAGVPAGCFNVVLGKGETGALLSKHPDLAKISFTGELGTGKKIIKDASGTLKKITMELGGKSPLIIFADANLDNAVSAAMMANWYSAGEVCSNGTRVFVEESIKTKFLEKLVERTRKMKIGNPLEEDTDIGSLIHSKHLEKVLSYVDIGKQEGANLVYGGERCTEGALAQGSFMSPAIFDQCNDNMRIVKEEIFGPVMSVLTFKTESEVVERANNTIYGLSGGVFTNDLTRAHRVVKNLQAGTTWINNYNLAPAELPWGGYKQSGLGRENGLEGLESYTQVKSVYVEMNDVWCPYK